MEDEELDEIPFEVAGTDLIVDTEADDRDRLDRRAKELGFRPQKEAIHNFLLPYADQLDDESVIHFQTIRENLLRAICLREMRPGYVTWVARLNKYLKLYGYKFSKEDHISMVLAIYKLFTALDVDPWLINKTGALLVVLLKKKDLLTPSDLTLPWRPLFDLYNRVIYSKDVHHGMLHYPPSIDLNLRDAIRTCRPYFEETATEEIMDVCRPMMCPMDTEMGKAYLYMQLFLPTLNCHERKESTYLLWFDEMMRYWTVCHNSPPWEGNAFCLLSRLAGNNIGLIDWEPYLSVIFTRIQKTFGLPVQYKQTSIGNKSVWMDLPSIVKWITSTMHRGSSTQKYLDQMFRALESYFHPANFGFHSPKLIDFLAKLTNSFISRLHKERYSKEKWDSNTPDDKKLTDQEVTDFVQSVQPIILHSMYCKVGFTELGAILQNLATLRPEIVIPPLIERMYLALETLTEPHKLTASLYSVVSVSRSLVHPGKFYPEGATHVIPLMMATLPGIDPNDMRKSMTTFQFISTFATLIPIVDCSRAHEIYKDLTEEERLICGQTAEFEDFVIQFLDRCFSLINSSTLEETRVDMSSSDHRVTMDENMKDVGLTSTFKAILTQCSSEIYDVALKKLQAFTTGRILETKIAGRIAANLIRCLVVARPERGVKVFIPQACDVINRLTNERSGKDEKSDEELKFNLLILIASVRIAGQYLLPHLDMLRKTLRQTLHLSDKDGYLLSCDLLRNILRGLTYICPIENQALPKGYDRPLEECLYIREWGKPGDIHNLEIKWNIPSEEEIGAAQNLIDEFLFDELTELDEFSSNKKVLTRDQLLNRLNVVLNILHGSGSALPFWSVDKDGGSSDPDACMSTHLVDSVTDLTPLKFITSPRPLELFLRGKNVRKAVLDNILKLQAHLLSEKEDDTRSLTLLVMIHQNLMMFSGIQKEEFDSRWRKFQLFRRVLENRLVGSRRHIRAIAIHRALLQHETRLLERSNTVFTTEHKKAAIALLDLATSHYSQVRSRAQDALCSVLTTFPHSYKSVMPDLIRLISPDNNEVTHEQFKGALYVLLGTKQRTLLVKHNWPLLCELWPALVNAKHSEKPSITRLTDTIVEALTNYIDTFALKVSLSDELINEVIKCWNFSSGDKNQPTKEEISSRATQVEASNTNNVACYDKLVERLCELIESGQLHWRRYNMAVSMICLLPRNDHPLSARAVQLTVKNLNHENIFVRKAAIHLVSTILSQQKRRHPKMIIPSPREGIPEHPGDREDNLWMCYDVNKVPKTEEEWNKRHFVHKTHFGFYTWPKEFQVYAKEGQPELNRDPSKLNEAERVIHDFFINEANIEKLIRFLSLEEHKGRDKFDRHRFSMFKGLFRNFGDIFLPAIRKHLERLVEDTHESSQRCAAEILASLIRGSKHWTFPMVSSMWSWLVPLIRVALERVTVETITDWGTCFATASQSRDPMIIHWMMEVLMEEPIRSRGSFIDSSRLYALQGALAQQEWRVGQLLQRLIEFLKQFLMHPYQNVRERLGSVLTNIFICDLEFGSAENSSNTRCPKISDFFNHVLPELEIMSMELDSSASTPPETGSPSGEPINGSGNAIVGSAAKASPPHPGMMPFPGPRMPPPEMMMMMMQRMPPPEMLARMPPPEMMMPRMIPPEILARMPNPEMLQRMPSPEMMARFLPPELLARLPNPNVPFPLGGVPLEFLPRGVPGQPPFFAANGVLPSKKSAEHEKRQVGIRLLQTVCKFTMGLLLRGLNGVRAEYFKILPMLCVNESNEFEPHLARDCTITLACLSQSILPLNVIPACLESIASVARSSSWRAKAAVLELLQVIAFSNMQSFLSREDWIQSIIEIVELTLRDDRHEVREKSGQVLSGLLHCEFIRGDQRKKLMDSFVKEVRVKLRKKRARKEASAASTADDAANSGSPSNSMDSIIARHSAVLGLCAFVNAYPYTVPEIIPDVLMILSEHLHDPQPIPATIKKTLQNFKRTHQDNWQDHKSKFSDDQLTVLTDLLVSPSYYA